MEYIVPIITALIAGGLSLIGVVITNNQSNKKIEQQLVTAQAVTDTKLQTLTDEVRKHNSFAERIPQIEYAVRDLTKRIERIERKNEQ